MLLVRCLSPVPRPPYRFKNAPSSVEVNACRIERQMASLLLFTLFALLCATVRAEGDYFLFVRQWDPTVCKVGKCSHTPGCRFTIHGLWPQYFNDTWPKFCTGEGFDPALVADLEPVLRREWPSVFSSNKAFWKHEWRKHGTCAESLCPLLSDEHSFFFAVLALNKMYDLNTVMNEAHIELETPHEQLWVEQMFEDTFKHGLAIHCYHEHHKSHGQSQEAVPIFEVWMCFDKQLQPFDCPANVRRRCHGNVIFPASDPEGAELLALSSQAASTINPGSSYQHSRMAITPQDTFDNNDDDHDTESTHGIMQALEELVTPGVPVIDAIREFQQRRDEFETN